MNKKHVVVMLFASLILIVACSTGGQDSSQVEATKMAIGIQQTQNAFIQMTLAAATASSGQPVVQPAETLDVAATQAAFAVQEQAETQQAAVQSATEPTMEFSPTVEAAGNQFDKIAELVRAEDADYYTVDDVDQAWNDKDEFWYKTVAEEAGDYVLSATVYWTAPADMGEPARNGCGFIYGMSDPKHFHVTVVSPDQKVHTYRKRSAEEIEMKGGDVPGGGLGVSSGEAELMVVVENKTMTAYVNGTQIVMFNDPYIDYGQMGLAVDAATYSGFTCSFKDIEVWVLK
jgi:hypothetical protein